MATRVAARVRAVEAPLGAPVGRDCNVATSDCHQYSQYKKAAYVEAALVLDPR